MSRLYPWADIVAELRRSPRRWHPSLQDVPILVARNVRERRAPELQLEDGVIECRTLMVYTTSEGQKRGNIHLRFVPNH